MSELSAASTSARELLVRWANQQDAWVRALAGEVLATRRDLSDAAVEKARDLYLAEKQLSTGVVPAIPMLGDDVSGDAAGENLRLISLRECRGVNALAERQTIEFNKTMTIVFGENATGKTGYVRVLKRVAAVRSAEPIIADIHRPSAAAGPEALIQYLVGDKERELDWHGESGVAPFTRISVFDSRAVPIHLENSVTYVYTPADLMLFKQLHSAVERVRAGLENEISTRQPRHNPFITAFARGTSIYPRIESLGASTKVDDLGQLAAVRDDEVAELDARRLSLEVLASDASDGRGEMLRNRAAIMRALLTLATSLQAFAADEFEKAMNADSASRARHADAARRVFGGQLLDAARPAWQLFIEASENYLQASGRNGYPTTSDDCIYCRRSLDVAAATLIRTYREYATGATASAVEAAASSVVALKKALLSPEVSDATTTLRATLPALAGGEQPSEWIADGLALLEAMERARDALMNGEQPRSDEWGGLVPSLVPRLQTALNEAETTLETIEGDAQTRAQRIAGERSEIRLLEARITLRQLLPEIRTYVESMSWADRLRTLLLRFPGLLKSLTEVTKSASDDVMNRDFERVFHEECAALRAPNVALDFPGKRGQAARRKSVARDHELAEILSEAEQKVIAMADFLAELSLRAGSAPIVFDDPVTSFDHRRVREIAGRIVDLSREHQVIVFTHNIWFASELFAKFEQRPSDYSYYQVVSDGGVTGVVSPASHPRQDTEASTRKQVNKAIQDARGGMDGTRQERIDLAYSHVRTWCETVIETELLGKVVRRYQPNVAVQNLQQIRVSRLQAAFDVIFPIWEKSCRYMLGHSQPLETLGVRPTIEELEQDWERLQVAFKAYSTG